MELAEINITLNNFMHGWETGDFEKMFSYCQKTWQEHHTVKGLELLLNSYKLKKYRIGKIKKTGQYSCDVELSVVFSIFRKSHKRKLTPRLIRETGAYKPDTNGKFGVNPVSLLKGL